MIGDRHFVVEAERAARLQAAVNSAPVYFYQFGYRGKHSVSEAMSGENTDFGMILYNISMPVLCSFTANTNLLLTMLNEET
jgi:carboxylesterase type B